MKANYITKRAKYSDFLQEWNEIQFNAVKIAARDFMKSAPAWDTFTGEGFRRRSFGMCNFYELENRLGLAYTSSSACAGLWLCNMSVYAPNDWHPTKAAGRYKITAFVMASDCSIWAAVEEENETDIYFLQIAAQESPALAAPANIGEEYKNELAKVWRDDTRMIKYCYGQASQVVRLSGGELVPIEKQKIKTDFCFGYNTDYTGHETSDAQRAAISARENEEYFRNKNLQELRAIVEAFDGKHPRQWVEYTPYIWQKYSGAGNIWGFGWLPCYDLDRRPSGVEYREVNPADVETLRAAYVEELAKMEKRVKSYLKRYGLKKIKTWIYWRDE